MKMAIRGTCDGAKSSGIGAGRYDGDPPVPPAPSPMPSVFLQAALDAADAAATLIRAAYRGSFAVDYKADASPVTEIDIAAERAIKAVLQARFPDHGFYGEELGQQSIDAEYLWLIDPIDGTKSFVRGYPAFSVQIALMHRGPPGPDGPGARTLVLGVSNAPCWNGGAGEVLYAERGGGAWLDGARLTVAGTSTIERATLSTGNLARLARSEAWPRLGALIPRLHRLRGYGDFIHYHWLAAGRIDAVIESDVNILDIAALSVIVTEAGGVFTDLEGAPLTLATTRVLAAVPALHAPLREALRYAPLPA